MVSITTQRPGTMSLRPSWLGNEPWIFSTNTSGPGDAFLRDPALHASTPFFLSGPYLSAYSLHVDLPLAQPPHLNAILDRPMSFPRISTNSR